MRTKSRILMAFVIAITSFSCKKYDNYTSVIHVKNDANGDVLYLAHNDGDTYPIGVLSLGSMVGFPGDTLTYVINWSDNYYEDLKPRTKDLFIFRAEYIGGFGYGYASSKATDGFRMLPSRVYYWDGQSDKLEDTGERTEKIEKSGCSALPGTYTLKTVNGYSLPYREAGSTAEIKSGSYMTFFSGGTWESTLYYTNTTNNSSGTTERNGTYTCSNSRGTFTNTSGISGSFTYENGEVRVVSGSTIMIYK